MSLLDAGKGEALVNEIMFSKMHYFSHDNYNKLKERRAEDGSVTPELVAQYETKDTKNGDWSFGLSDEMEAFLEFKKATGGVIYQHVKVKITERNQEYISNLASNDFEFKLIPHTKIVPDKRLKSGSKEVTTYTYSYWGKEYSSLKEINKHGVYIRKEIHFETLLDLIPYYQYLVSASSHSNGKTTVYITDESYPDIRYKEGLTYGYDTNGDLSKHDLAEHYIEVVKKYYLNEYDPNKLYL